MTKRVMILLTSSSDHLENEYVKPFKKAMGSGVTYVEAFSADYRLAQPDVDAYVSAQIKNLNPDNDVIWTISSSSARAAMKATKQIPIVVSALSSVDEQEARAAPNVS